MDLGTSRFPGSPGCHKDLFRGGVLLSKGTGVTRPEVTLDIVRLSVLSRGACRRGSLRIRRGIDHSPYYFGGSEVARTVRSHD